eukprot:SAG31_NODE_35701_length_320_cov_1.398190_1_plen_51_part_10
MIGLSALQCILTVRLYAASESALRLFLLLTLSYKPRLILSLVDERTLECWK